MTERDVETILQRAREQLPDAHPRIISDNGPQFIAKDFKEFLRVSGMTHVKTSPYYPQSNGKLERFHGTLKGECLRPGTPLSLDDARRIVANFVSDYVERVYGTLDELPRKFADASTHVPNVRAGSQPELATVQLTPPLQRKDRQPLEEALDYANSRHTRRHPRIGPNAKDQRLLAVVDSCVWD